MSNIKEMQEMWAKIIAYAERNKSNEKLVTGLLNQMVEDIMQWDEEFLELDESTH